MRIAASPNIEQSGFEFSSRAAGRAAILEVNQLLQPLGEVDAEVVVAA